MDTSTLSATACIALGAAIYASSYISNREYRLVRAAAVCRKLKDLEHILTAAADAHPSSSSHRSGGNSSGGTPTFSTSDAPPPVLVAVTGQVHAPDPLFCQYGDGSGALVQLRTFQEILLRRRPGHWVHQAVLLASCIREAAWSLIDSSGGRVGISLVNDGGSSGAGSAAGGGSSGGASDMIQRLLQPSSNALGMCGGGGAGHACVPPRGDAVGANLFSPSKASLVRKAFDFVNGIRVLGLRYNECVLPLGATVTAVGELVAGDSSAIGNTGSNSSPLLGNAGKAANTIVDGFSAASPSGGSNGGALPSAATASSRGSINSMVSKASAFSGAAGAAAAAAATAAGERQFFLRPPASGGPFYVARGTLPQLLERLGARSRRQQLVSRLLLLLGLLLLLRRLRQKREVVKAWCSDWLRWICRVGAHYRAVLSGLPPPPIAPDRGPLSPGAALVREAEYELEVAGGSPPQVSQRGALSRATAKADLCVVCFERPGCAVFLNCGHMGCCVTCAHHVVSTSGQCPFCRNAIERVVRTFRP
eukprot:jgi/Mesvir1/11694/Mv00086-RA.1